LPISAAREGGLAVFPRVEVRHLHAVIVLAEELNFTRAADRLHITQSGFSKQINEIEAVHRFHLFVRTNKKNVELTEVGRIFVEEARLALWHIDRAVHAAREGSDSILTIGHSPDADLTWISAILSIRLPMYPKLRVQLISEFSSELVRRVMAGDLNMALVTAPSENSRITAAPFAQTHLYAALPQTHAAAHKEDVAFQDLAKDEWILFAWRSYPVVRAAIMEAAQRQGIVPRHAHDILTAQEAIHLVSQHVGVAIVTKPTSVGLSAEGVVIRPLSDPSLAFETCLIMRADEDSRLANDFGRSFLRRYAPQRQPPKQMELWLSA
jgi:DNA-binding transcriptional LysR family regulator